MRALGVVGVFLAVTISSGEEAQVRADPFLLPPEAQQFVRKATLGSDGTQGKLQALLRAIFAPRDKGGMGLAYDNMSTRSVADVWAEGRANCLSLTAFYVAACRFLGVREDYAEVLNSNHWRRQGSIIRFERHVVALTSLPGSGDLIADFVPELRKRFGVYSVVRISERRFRALYYSNLAVEALEEADLDGAQEKARLSLDADPTSAVGWNVLGVVQGASGEPAQAEAAYRRALALDPRDGAVIGNLESLMRETGRVEEQLRFREMGEKVRKKDPYFHAYLAEEALGKGDLDEAGRRLKAALKLLPREADFHLLRARLKQAEGDLDGARREVAEAQRLSGLGERERFEGKLAYLEELRRARSVPPPRQGNR